MIRPEFLGKVGFAIGTGRCGTEFLARVIESEPGVASVHERNPYNETFHRYTQWYRLPVDHEGFLKQKEREICHDLDKSTFSFESSAYLSLSVLPLHERFGARFLLLVRSPERVVNSFFHKGWYASPTVRANPELAPGYQKCKSFHHVLARFTPSGAEFTRWNQMTRIGKLAWFWQALNARVLEQFSALPAGAWRVEKLETFDHARYRETAEFLGFAPQVSEEAFARLAGRKPNAFSNVPTIASWSPAEIAEFEAEVGPVAEKLGYEYRVDRLPLPEVKEDNPTSRLPLLQRLANTWTKG